MNDDNAAGRQSLAGPRYRQAYCITLLKSELAPRAAIEKNERLLDSTLVQLYIDL